MTKMSKWAEIRNNYIEETDEGFRVLHIDSWKTSSDNEEGRVIAKLVGINKDGEPCIYTSYEDPEARVDEYAQESIKEGLKNLTEQLKESGK